MSDLETTSDWWLQLVRTALFGTTRRPVPPLPDLGIRPRPEAGPELALLDAAAVGSALRRAPAVPPHHGDPPETAPAADEPLVSPRATQLLHVLLSQDPAGARNREHLLAAWCEAAAGRRVPESSLPLVLHAGTTRPELRPHLAQCLGSRGRWLAGQRPEWSWALPVAAEPVDWSLATTDQRRIETIRVRRERPAAAVDLLRSTWSSDPARVRAEQLLWLRDGLGPDDEEFLEAALDDRAATVREAAAGLLDRLPGSARAERMRQRLQQLVTAGDRILVELPGDPDASARRDGLDRATVAGASRRGQWLTRIAAATPLDFWTRLSGLSIAATLDRIDGIGAAEAKEGIRLATLHQGDQDWAKALLAAAGTADPPLIALLADRDEVAITGIRAESDPKQIGQWIHQLPGPWSARLSREVLTALRTRAGLLAAPWLAEIGTRLHPDLAPFITEWLEHGKADPATVRELRMIIQLQSLQISISEALR